MPQRVLIVDDDAVFRQALVDAFAAAEYQVEAAAAGSAALTAALSRPPDVAIVDLVLPDVTGFELLAALRRDVRTRDVPVVLVTAKTDRAVLIQAFRMGVDDFLFKPLDVAELMERCRIAVQRRAAARSSTPAALPTLVRRDLTALFCDVRGFTRVVADMDPETMVTVLNGLFDALVGDVARHGGTVDKFVGDGMLALFGAHDNSGQNELRAIRAGLDMVESAKHYSRESLILAQRPISVGVGIACGASVVGLVGGQVRYEVTAIGEAVNLAARLQALAHEGEVIIDATAHERAGRALELGPARTETIKGFGSREVYRVLGIRPDGWFA